MPKRKKVNQQPYHKTKKQRFFGFAISALLWRFLLLLIIVGLLYWLTPDLIKLGVTIWHNLLELLGAGLVLIALAIGILIWTIWRRQFPSLLKRWNWCLGAIVLTLALWGTFAFFKPGEGILSQVTLGGNFGKNLIGSPDIFGGLRVAGLIFLGILFIAPQRSWQVAVAFARALAKTKAKRPTIIKKAEIRQETITPQISPTEAPKLEVPPKPEKLPVFTAGGWQLPPIDILDKAIESELSQSDIEKRAQLIEEALNSYGVEAKVIQINIGPTVTQFGVEPGWDRKYKEIRERDKDGNVKVRLQEVSRIRVRVERISSLANDLALALAAPTIRIEAPVPGKPVIGIEVPNTTFGLVNLRSVIETTAFQKIKARSKLALALGKGAGGETVAADLTKMPHLLIAGATGSGKTVCLNSVICCLLFHNTPNDVRFIMLDPKRVELVIYNGIPHLLSSVIVDTDKAIKALRWLNQEMDNRYRQFAQEGARNIESYNKDKHPSEGMPYLILIIDELADLMMAAFDEVEHTLCRLAQLARATGIHLVVATQRPSVDIVTGLIKANFPTRISFAVTSQVDSRTILDTIGAEKLLGRGDMLYMPTEATRPKRLQGTFVTDHEIQNLVYFWANQQRPEVIPIKFEEVTEAPYSAIHKASQDPLLEEARRLAQEHKHISTSFLQRRLRIGYPRAARLMEVLEAEGFSRHEES